MAKIINFSEMKDRERGYQGQIDDLQGYLEAVEIELFTRALNLACADKWYDWNKSTPVGKKTPLDEEMLYDCGDANVVLAFPAGEVLGGGKQRAEADQSRPDAGPANEAPGTSDADMVRRVMAEHDGGHIGSERTAAEADLPVQPMDYGRVSKGVADAILANMYLNAAVFTQDDPTQLDGHYNSCMSVQIGSGTACQAAIDAADRILNSGVYTLAADFKDNFSPTNYNSPENIFVANFADVSGLGLNFVMRALHYNQFTPAPWNGFSTLASTYNAFDSLDARRQDVFLIGPQDNVLTGQPVTDRQGNPLVFTETIGNITSANEDEGVRYYKWPADPDHVNENNGNDYAFFRLGEIYLIKAEALNEITPGDGTALTLVNNLRARDFSPAKPLGSIDRSAILNERLFELTFEAKRRQDLIRFGTFTQAWTFKAPTDARVILLPIPQPQLDANPQLSQNPGY